MASFVVRTLAAGVVLLVLSFVWSQFILPRANSTSGRNNGIPEDALAKLLDSAKTVTALKETLERTEAAWAKQAGVLKFLALKSAKCPQSATSSETSSTGMKYFEEAERQYQENIRQRDAILSSSKRPKNRGLVVEMWLLPTYSCLNEARIGLWGEGGKWICLSTHKQKQHPLAVSVGSLSETSFEEQISERLGGFTHTFDFSLSKQQNEDMRSKKYLKFYTAGLASANAIKTWYKNHKNMVNTPQLLNLINATYVDYFKIDCERCELGIMYEMAELYTRETVPFGQIEMELHDVNDGRAKAIIQGIKALEGLGYRLFHSEINPFYPEGFELAYIHESLVKPVAL